MLHHLSAQELRSCVLDKFHHPLLQVCISLHNIPIQKQSFKDPINNNYSATCKHSLKILPKELFMPYNNEIGESRNVTIQEHLPSRKKQDSTVFLKQMSSAASTHRANFALNMGKPLNPHITGSSNLLYNHIILTNFLYNMLK